MSWEPPPILPPRPPTLLALIGHAQCLYSTCPTPYNRSHGDPPWKKHPQKRACLQWKGEIGWTEICCSFVRDTWPLGFLRTEIIIIVYILLILKWGLLVLSVFFQVLQSGQEKPCPDCTLKITRRLITVNQPDAWQGKDSNQQCYCPFLFSQTWVEEMVFMRDHHCGIMLFFSWLIAICKSLERKIISTPPPPHPPCIPPQRLVPAFSGITIVWIRCVIPLVIECVSWIQNHVFYLSANGSNRTITDAMWSFLFV